MYAPKPGRGFTSRYHEAVASRSGSWNYSDGSYGGSLSRSAIYRDSFCTVPVRTSNKVSVTPKGIWKPCAPYRIGMILERQTSGSASFSTNKGKPSEQWQGQPALGNQRILGPFVAPDGTPNGIPINSLNRLNTELLNRIGSRKASYGEAIAEGQKTARHLAGTFSQLAHAALAAKRKDFRGVAKALGLRSGGRNPAKSWLEYQYAWRPLIGDIFATATLFQDGLRKRNQLMRTARVLKDYHTQSSPNHASQYRAGGNSSVRYTGVCFYRINDSSLATMSEIGLINPLEVAWAVMPYSFVIDWMIPIGNLLEAMTAAVGCDFVDGYYGVKSQSSYWTEPYISPGVWWSDPGTYRVSMRTETLSEGYARTKMTSFPMPGLYVKNPFSLSHVTSALALLTQLRRG